MDYFTLLCNLVVLIPSIFLVRPDTGPWLGRELTTGLPLKITFRARDYFYVKLFLQQETKVLSGVDVELFKIIARKFLLRVTMKPERTWLEKLENGTITGTIASVRDIHFNFTFFLTIGS